VDHDLTLAQHEAETRKLNHAKTANSASWGSI